MTEEQRKMDLEAVIRVLNEARCLSKKIVGNRELAHRVFEVIPSHMVAQSPMDEDVREALDYISLFCGVHVRNDVDRKALEKRFDVIRAATAQRCEWLDISDCPLGANDIKTSHVILVNKYGNICRGYRIHDGTGKYKIHNPFYNEHGQTFHPIGWMPLPAAPVEKSAEVG